MQILIVDKIYANLFLIWKLSL